MNWPELSSVKSISGRVATQQDVDSGKAVFTLHADGRDRAKPVNISIPQYGMHISHSFGEISHVIIIQAEEANGKQVLGALKFNSNDIITDFLEEFLLLGTVRPGN